MLLKPVSVNLNEKECNINKMHLTSKLSFFHLSDTSNWMNTDNTEIYLDKSKILYLP